MLEAFRVITVQVNVGQERDIEVPFDVDLLQRVEETIQKCEGSVWIRLGRKDKSILDAFEWFCKPYLPKLDYAKVQPTFCALFFSRVRDELLRSIDACQSSMKSTGTPPGPTGERTGGLPSA